MATAKFQASLLLYNFAGMFGTIYNYNQTSDTNSEFLAHSCFSYYIYLTELASISFLASSAIRVYKAAIESFSSLCVLPILS